MEKKSDAMDIGKIVIAGVAAGIIAEVIHSIEAIFTMPYYFLPEYWTVWSKIMMPGPGPPGMEFYALAILFSIVAGILYAFVFDRIKPALSGTAARKGLSFGGILFLAAGIPGTLTMFLLINLPISLVTIWTFTNYITYLASGFIIAKIIG